jgi:DDE superfamily endonuclease
LDAGFQKISTQECIWNCVAVLDGYHLQIDTPSKKEAKNVKSFFSGHYQTYGVNIQAACDPQCRFWFIGVAGPGVMGDREAITQKNLISILKSELDRV